MARLPNSNINNRAQRQNSALIADTHLPDGLPRVAKRSSLGLRDFLLGEVVTIFKVGPTYRPSIEGRATIVSPCKLDANIYNVQFDGEVNIKRRIVLSGDWQTNSEKMLRELLVFWQANVEPESFGLDYGYGMQRREPDK